MNLSQIELAHIRKARLGTPLGSQIFAVKTTDVLAANLGHMFLHKGWTIAEISEKSGYAHNTITDFFHRTNSFRLHKVFADDLASMLDYKIVARLHSPMPIVKPHHLSTSFTNYCHDKLIVQMMKVAADAGWSRAAMARKMGVSFKSIQRVTNGEGSPTYSFTRKLAKITNHNLVLEKL